MKLAMQLAVPVWDRGPAADAVPDEQNVETDAVVVHPGEILSADEIAALEFHYRQTAELPNSGGKRTGDVFRYNRGKMMDVVRPDDGGPKVIVKVGLFEPNSKRPKLTPGQRISLGAPRGERSAAGTELPRASTRRR